MKGAITALDFGDRRIGVARCDATRTVVTPVTVLERRNREYDRSKLGEIICQQDSVLLLIGLPLNMDGSEGPAATKSRQLADELAARTGLVVHLADERLTSDAADDALRQSGLTRKARKAHQDAQAAAAILNRFFSDR